jgi:hypothetical protein
MLPHIAPIALDHEAILQVVVATYASRDTIVKVVVLLFGHQELTRAADLSARTCDGHGSRLSQNRNILKMLVSANWPPGRLSRSKT